MHDFLDNLGAQQYEKIMEKNATKEEITNTCEETYGKKSATKKPTTTPKAKRIQRLLQTKTEETST